MHRKKIEVINLMTTYTTLNKEKLSLDNFSEEQKDLLKEVYNLFKQGSYMYLINFTFSEETLEKLGARYRFGGYWVDEQVRKEPLYRVVEDLETRLAIDVGRLGKNPKDDLSFEANEKVLEEYLNAKQD